MLPPLPFMDSVYVALFLMIIVFSALFCLYLSVRLFSLILTNIVKARTEDDGNQ